MQLLTGGGCFMINNNDSKLIIQDGIISKSHSKTFRREYLCAAARMFSESGSGEPPTALLHTKN